MGLGKTYSTKYLVDSNGNTGAANQVLVSTATGVDWVDGSGSGIIGGPYLPLTAGASYPLTDTLYGTKATFGDTNIDVATVTIEGGLAGILDIWRNGTNASYQAIRFRDDTNANTEASIGWGSNQLRLNGTSTIVATTGGSEKMRIDSSGNVGIGTTSPQQKLQVASPSDTSVVLGASYLSTNNNNFFEVGILANDGYLNLRNSGVVSTVHIDSDGNSYFNGGNVGIGTTSPSTKLHVAGIAQVAESGNSAFYGGNYVRVFNDQNYGFRNTGGTYIANISMSGNSYFNGGNVGIGTTSPLHKLHVNGASDGNSIYTAMLQNTGTAAGTASKLLFVQGGSTIRGAVLGGLQESASGSPTSMVFETSAAYATPTERMRITSTGNVGIGTANPTVKLQVYDDSSSQLKITNGLATPVDLHLFASSSSYAGIGTASNHRLALRTNNTEKVTILANGNVGIGTTSPSSLLSVGNAAIHNNPSTTVNIATTDTGAYLLKATSDQFNADGNWVGIGLGYSNNYMKMGIIAEAKDGNARGKLHFAVNTTAGSSNAGISDAKMTIDNSGNVGIGTTSPSAKLDVEGDILIKAANLSNQENTDVDTGTEVVATVAIATYTAAFFDFVIKNGTNVRSGTVFACHDGTNVEFTETSTADLGNTSALTLSVDISAGNMRLLATATTDNWSVKTLVRAL